MAWRDSRGSRRRLLLLLSSMVLGVAALVAIHGFGANLRHAVQSQARELLGADLALESRHPFSEDTEALIDSVGGRQARRISFSSMAIFPKGEGTRLVRVRAVEGGYPFYGRLVTAPPAAASTYLSGGPRALVDATLMSQFNQTPGDSVRIGAKSYAIAGALEKMPQESGAISLVSPRVYLPLAELDTTLLAAGSRAEYDAFFKFEEGRNVKRLAEEMAPYLREHDIRSTTAAEEAENWGDGLANLYKFLSLVAFMALLLGGLGIASAVHVYVKQRLETIAVLRCLGASSGRTFSVYLLQAATMGGVCAILGTTLGLGVQALLPRVMADFLPVAVPFHVNWGAVALGAAIGVFGTLLFALIPLVSVRRVSPLRSLRADYESSEEERDLLKWGLYGLLASVVAGTAVLQAPTWEIGMGYAAGLAVAFGLLALTARVTMTLTRRFLPSSWSYPLRQGLANLFRPRNQTVMLTLALGFGTFLILTLYLVQMTLLAQLQVSQGQNQPNIIFFGIQPDQVEGVEEAVQERGRPVMGRIPLVTMRLQRVKGRSVESIKADSSADYTWAHRREYRSTYRDSLTTSEEVVAGTFERSSYGGNGPVPVSVEEDIAEELGVALGDTLVFDVQGVPVTTVVGSLRRVDWQRMSTNFFVVFPEDVLEEAPQTYVVLTRAGGSQASAALQSAIATAFPNVIAIDATLILDVFDALFSRLAFVVRFMALFSILTGLIVLAGAVVVSRYQRIEESVLLKTLGASRRQVLQIILTEYFFLGLLAALAGVALAVVAGWLLARFVFETPLVVEAWPLAAAASIVTGLTVGIGFLSSSGVYARPPLRVLQDEV